MAVYQGARPRSILLSPAGRSGESPSLPRRRVRAAGATRARRRSNHSSFLIGGIVLVFLLAFFSLAQTVSVSATSYDYARLGADRDQLQARVRDVQSDLNRLGREPAIRKQAIDLGLGQLADVLVVPAR